MTDIVLKVLYICSLIYSPQRLYQAVLTLFQWLVNCLKKAVSRSHVIFTLNTADPPLKLKSAIKRTINSIWSYKSLRERAQISLSPWACRNQTPQEVPQSHHEVGVGLMQARSSLVSKLQAYLPYTHYQRKDVQFAFQTLDDSEKVTFIF